MQNGQSLSHQEENTHEATVPRPINSSGTTVIMLIPELDSPKYTDLWQSSFNKLAKIFSQLGVNARVAPWSMTPLAPSNSHMIYLANLAWAYYYFEKRWETWLNTWPSSHSKITLVNSPKLLAWNTSKIYLQELEVTKGVPGIPTLFVDHVDESTLIEAATCFKVDDLIIKPQVSGDSYQMLRVFVTTDDNSVLPPKSVSVKAAIAFLKNAGVADSPMMIQPFLSSVLDEGEYSVFVFNGKVSHATLKNASSNDYRVQAEHGGSFTTIQQPLSNEILELTYAVLAACPEMPVYARIDMIRNNATGRLCLIELALIEPDLHLNHASDDGKAFAIAVLEAAAATDESF